MYTLDPLNTRYSGRISFGLLAWMVASAIIAASAGVSYAVLKNSQVAEHTEIEKINREIAICRLNTNQYRAKADALTNRWAMRDRLNQDGSSLRDITHDQVELARSTRETASINATASR